MAVLLKITKELEFQVGKDDTAMASFKIDNISKETAAYKIKTTAPKRYTVRPNAGVVNPGESAQLMVCLNLAKDPKRDAEPDKFQIISLTVKGKPPKPDDDNYSEYLKKLFNSVTDKDKVNKDRLKIVIKKDAAPSGGPAERNPKLTLGTNLSFRNEKRETPVVTGRDSARRLETISTDIPDSRNRTNPIPQNETNRGRDGSRNPPERRTDNTKPLTSPVDQLRDGSRSPERARPTESRDSRPKESRDSRPKDRPMERSRESSRTLSKGGSRSREASREARSYPDMPRYRESSVGPADRERPRSRYDDDYRGSSRSRERSLSRDPRDYDRDRRRRGDDRYDRSVSRGRRWDDDDDGYRSSRDYSRSRSGSRLRDEYFDRSRSRSRSSSRDYRYLRQAMEERPMNRQLDGLIRRYEDLNVKTTQKTQERQLLFVAVAFFIGFIFAQGIIF